jgi:hypothetical protein
MPPVLFLALVAAAGIAGYRVLSNLAGHVEAARRKSTSHMRRAAAPARDLGSLEWDERAGVYRPQSKQES